MNTIERKKSLETLLLQKTRQFQQIDEQKNMLITEIVKIQGKIELLKELEIEENSTNKKIDENEKSIENAD